MTDIAGFLVARLDEVEAVAKLADRKGGTWTQDDPERYPGSITSLGGQVVYDEGSPDENQAPHIALHDPARVLREVAAKRAILELHRPERWNADDDPADIHCVECTADDDLYKAQMWPCATVRHLAAVYSDHPDYDQEWRP